MKACKQCNGTDLEYQATAWFKVKTGQPAQIPIGCDAPEPTGRLWCCDCNESITETTERNPETPPKDLSP